MKASIFDQLQAQAFRAGIKTRTNQSMNWFSKRVKELGTINRRQLLKDGRLKDVGKDEVVGSMYMYFYDPKLKKTLPYYCLLYTSPSPRDRQKSRMPSSA